VPNLYELQLLSMGPKGFKHSVYTVSGKAEDHFYSPIDEPLYDHVCYCHHTLLRILRTGFAVFVRAVPEKEGAKFRWFANAGGCSPTRAASGKMQAEQ
jgi:hypothetical protein